SGGGVIRFGCSAGEPETQFQTAGVLSSPLSEFELDRDAQIVFRLIDRALRGPWRNPDRPTIRREKSARSADGWEHHDEVIGAELQSGEVLLWSGRPHHGMIWSWYEFAFAAIAFLWMNAWIFGPFGGGAANQQLGVGLVWVLVAFKVLHVSFHLG